MKRALHFLVVLPFVAGCMLPVQTDGEAQMVLRFAPSALTKGSIDPGDNEVASLSVFIYSNGYLYQDVRVCGAEADVVLEEGKTYGVYALANASNVCPPVLESDLDTLRFRIRDIGELSEGLPMAFFGPGALTARRGAQVQFELVRLVSKWEVNVNINPSGSIMILQSIRLRQAALDVTPFAPCSKAQRVGDGDWIDQPRNSAAGNKVTLYTLENARGVLLPGNDNPACKTRDRLQEVCADPDLCTYLEIRLSWHVDKASGIFNTKTYLGKDLCSDFSVMRNTAYSLNVEFSDGVPVEESWRMEMEELNDFRRFDIPEDDVLCPQGSGWHVVPLNANFRNQPIYVESLDEADYDKYKVDFVRDGDVLRFRSRYVGRDTASFRYDVYTWDRLVSGRIVYRLTGPDSDPVDFVDNSTVYHWQEGNLAFPDRNDVILYFEDGSRLRLEDVRPKLSVMCGGVLFYLDQENCRINTRVLSVNGQTTAVVTCGGKSSKVKVGPNLFPRLKYDRPYLKLVDYEGREMDVTTFVNNGRNYGAIIKCEDLPSKVTYTVSQPEEELLQNNSVAKIEFTSKGTVSATPVTIISKVLNYELSVASSLTF